jgi:hypothetical protein
MRVVRCHWHGPLPFVVGMRSFARRGPAEPADALRAVAERRVLANAVVCV